MRDHPELRLRHTERREHLTATRRVDDDAVEAREQRAPEARAARRTPRQQIVRGEDERAIRTEQEPVELRHGEPLEVDDVRRAREHAARGERVLEPA
jgi:hypothetical protein